MKNTITFSLIFFFLTFNKISLSQYGQLDHSFGQDGIVTTAINVNSNSSAYSVAIQEDGKIIVGGRSYNLSVSYDGAIVRYNSDGSFDNTFGTGGVVTNPFGSPSDLVQSVAIQNDGKIIAAGRYWNESDYDFAVARCNPDGTLDNSFGTSGIVITPIGENDWLESVAIQSDGKIIVTGSSDDGNDIDFAVVRYNSNGFIDNTFGTNGIVTTQIGSSNNCAYTSIIQSDGKIIVAGKSNKGNDYSVFALVRYLDDASTGVDEETKEIIPAEFSLEQNYPNPFNPTTNFEFRIAEYGFVSLKVYDVLGNEVAILVNEEKPAGTYEITFDASSLSSGVYFYRLQAGSFVETRKMILLR